MGKTGIGINLEFVRHEDKPFEWGVNKAAALDYDYVEPMDISVSQSAAERGQVTGTPVGCACGEGGHRLGAGHRNLQEMPARHRIVRRMRHRRPGGSQHCPPAPAAGVMNPNLTASQPQHPRS